MEVREEGETVETLPFSAVVLAGGASRRMGKDKALIPLGGRTVLETILDKLQTISDDVRILGGGDVYRQFGVPVLADDYPGKGPLGGIATAIAHAEHDITFVVACDMPLVRPDVILRMASMPRTYDALVVSRRTPNGARLEPLHAFYASSVLAQARRLLTANELRVESLFNHVDTRIINERDLRCIDPDLQSFANMNTPEDVDRVKEMMGEV